MTQVLTAIQIARLISAAPDLLEAVKAVYAGSVDFHGGYAHVSFRTEKFKLLEAAIAKAEGKL